MNFLVNKGGARNDNFTTILLNLTVIYPKIDKNNYDIIKSKEKNCTTCYVVTNQLLNVSLLAKSLE